MCGNVWKCVKFNTNNNNNTTHHLQDDDCLAELRIQLGTIFITNLVIDSPSALISTIIKRAQMRKKETTQENVSIIQLCSDESEAELNQSPAEKEYNLIEYESTFDDFDEVVIMYGYLLLFVIAFPLGPLIVVINNLLEVRLDAMKLNKFARRPLPRGAADIGVWSSILNIVSVMAIMTNVALVVFETDTCKLVYVYVCVFRVFVLLLLCVIHIHTSNKHTHNIHTQLRIMLILHNTTTQNTNTKHKHNTQTNTKHTQLKIMQILHDL